MPDNSWFSIAKKRKSYREITASLNLSENTVADIIRRFQRDRIQSIPQTARSKILNIRECRQIVQKIQQNPRLSAPKLAVNVSKETFFSGKRVHPQTIRQALKENGYNGRVARKKSFIDEANRRKRDIRIRI